MRMLPMVFMPVFFGAMDGYSAPDMKKIGLVWEWMSEAGQVGVNGMPMFASCRVMLASDWERARIAIDAELKRRKEIKV